MLIFEIVLLMAGIAVGLVGMFTFLRALWLIKNIKAK